PKGSAPSPVATMSALAEKDKLTSLLWANAGGASLATAREFFKSNNGPPKPGQVVPPPPRIVVRALEAHYHFITVIGSKVAAIDFITSVYKKNIGVLAASQQFFIDDTTSQEAL